MEKIFAWLTIPQDKAIHIIGGVVMFALFHHISLLFAVAVVLSVAFGKEVYDYFHRDKHTPEVLDAVATICGGALGLICTL